MRQVKITRQNGMAAIRLEKIDDAGPIARNDEIARFRHLHEADIAYVPSKNTELIAFRKLDPLTEQLFQFGARGGHHRRIDGSTNPPDEAHENDRDNYEVGQDLAQHCEAITTPLVLGDKRTYLDVG